MAARKVRVPQADGEIVFTTGDGARTFIVADHLVSPANNAERDELLRLVDGARLAKESEAPPASPNSGSGTPAGANTEG